MPKAGTMLSVLWLLHSRKRMTAAEIAKELEISVRTVYRCIHGLCASGVPIVSESGHDGGFRLLDNFRKTPLFFDLQELRAIFHAAKFARRAGYPFSEDLNRALLKIEQNLSPYQIQDLQKHTEPFGVVSSNRGGTVEPWLAILADAVAEGKSLDILYHKVMGEEPEWRTVDPYGIAFDSGVWYAAVYCHKRQAMRDFRIDRILDIRPNGRTFNRPHDFSIEEFFSNRTMIDNIQRGPFTEVVIRGSVWAIQSIIDHWYLRYCVKSHTRNQVHLNLNKHSESVVPSMLLGYGTNIEIIEPQSMRDRLVELAGSWLEHHRVGPKVR